MDLLTPSLHQCEHQSYYCTFKIMGGSLPLLMWLRSKNVPRLVKYAPCGFGEEGLGMAVNVCTAECEAAKAF